MSDFDILSDRQQALLRIKLDGFIEAAVQAARTQSIGVSESLSLTMLAVVRELAAHSVNRDRAVEIWEAAVDKTYNRAREPSLRTVN